MIDKKIFKAYDIRGVYPTEVNEEAFKRIAQSYARFVNPTTVAVGHDVRISSPSLHAAVIEGLTSCGVNVIDIGAGPTEMIYFAVGFLGVDGGIQVSASHNPAEYNGLKMIRGGVEAISSDNGLNDIRDLALGEEPLEGEAVGSIEKKNLEADYLAFLEKFTNLENLPKIRIVANNNFGLSGELAKKVLTKTAPQTEIVELNFEPNGNFPKGRPDPLIPENRAEVSQLITSKQANLGVAWDADGDRCYLADEQGEFIEGCHLTAILAEYLLKTHAGEKILYDPRNVWAVEETVAAIGGQALINKAGHTFIKNRMKKEQALFAGEMSGHFYFRDFFFADNGILPFIYFLNIIAETGKTASEIARPFREKYFVSGEMNFHVNDIEQTISAIKLHYQTASFDETDGLSADSGEWRFNLRGSNTEPLLRLNVEAKTEELCQEKTEELKSLLSTFLAN